MKKKVAFSICGLLLVSSITGGAYLKDTKTVQAQGITIEEKIKKTESIYNKENMLFTKPVSEVEELLEELETVLKGENLKLISSEWVNTEDIDNKMGKVSSAIQELEKNLDTYYLLQAIYGKDFDYNKDISKLTIVKDSEKSLEELTKKHSGDSSLDKEVSKYIKEAKNQVAKNNKAKEKVSKVFKENKVISTKKEEIAEAKKVILEVKDENLQKEYQENLVKVEEQFKKEEQARKKKEEEERIAREKAEKEEKARLEKARLEAEEAERARQEQLKADRSWGVHIDGITAPIGYYTANGGYAPINTPEAYLWSLEGVPANWYGIDYMNSLGLGHKVLALQVGDPVYIHGVKHTVVGDLTVQSGATVDEIPFGYSAYLQTCWSSSPTSSMRVVFLNIG